MHTGPYDDESASVLLMDQYLKENGYEILHCSSDTEAIDKSEALQNGSNQYPVYYSASNTSGEKAYEEFYIPGEKINMDRFMALGVVEETTHRPMPEVNKFFVELEELFAREDFTKADVVAAIKRFIPNFEHEEKGKNLDQKM